MSGRAVISCISQKCGTSGHSESTYKDFKHILRDKNRAQAPLPERVAFDSGRLPLRKVAFDLQEKAKNPFFSLFSCTIQKLVVTLHPQMLQR